MEGEAMTDKWIFDMGGNTIYELPTTTAYDFTGDSPVGAHSDIKEMMEQVKKDIRERHDVILYAKNALDRILDTHMSAKPETPLEKLRHELFWWLMERVIPGGNDK